MDPDIRRLIESIHRSAVKCVLVMTGGGATAAGTLLQVPGGSRTILEVVVPYQEQALLQFLGRRPPQFCSAATSREMAIRAYERAVWLAPGENRAQASLNGERTYGFGCAPSGTRPLSVMGSTQISSSVCGERSEYRIHLPWAGQSQRLALD